MDIFNKNFSFILLVILLFISVIYLKFTEQKKENFENIEEDVEGGNIEGGNPEICELDIPESQQSLGDLSINSIFSKNSCEDEELSCNTISPYSELVLYGTNPLTKQPYTASERNEKKAQYKNICDVRGKKSDRCCDPKDPRLQNLDKLIDSDIKKMYPYVKKIMKNGKEVYSVCRESKNNCIEKGYIKLGAYDMCKMSNNDLTQESCVVENLVPDCFTAKCINHSTFDIDPYVSQNNYFEDYHLVEAIKADSVKSLMDYYKDNRNLDRQLVYGYQGNTVLHEATYHNAKLCVDYILKNQVDLTITNKDGNNPLHVSCLKGNAEFANKLINLGADLSEKNNKGDTPLHCGIRSANLDIVVLLINKGSSIEDINNLGETPLHVALESTKKNIKIVIYLINTGSNIYTKNTREETILKSLNRQEKTAINEEVRTYIQKIAFEKHENNNELYIPFLNNNPEFRPYEIDIPEGDEQPSNITGIDIDYDTNLKPKELYYNSYRKPVKTLSPRTKNVLDDYKL